MAAPEAKRYRLGVDVGGTFTDLLLMERGTGATYPQKTPSTVDPERAIVTGIERYVDGYGIDPGDIEYFSHGTTLALNTLVQRNGARGGLLTTEGFRDLLELRRLRLSQPNNLFVPRPVPLVPRRRVREVRERLRFDGTVLVPIERGNVEAEAAALVESGVETIAVAFVHAHRNDAHERLARQWIADLFPHIYVCTSAEIWPQQREYERALAAVMNAYVGARMQTYFHRLEREIESHGLGCRVFSTKSNGGVMSLEAAAERPVETLLSGPASGVIGAAFIGRLIGDRKLVTLDMGGASVDVSVVDAEVAYSTENTVGDFPGDHPGGRCLGHRRGGRLDRLGGCRRGAQGRAAKRRCGARTRLLPPRRRGRDGDRRLPRSRHPATGQLSRRRDAASRAPARSLPG